MTARRLLSVASGALVLVCALPARPAAARDLQNDGVASANPRYDLVAQPTRVAGGFSLALLARGAARLENPSGVITQFGFLNDFPPRPIEASKTEPDENTYLVLDHNPGGPAAGFDYGRHFLFQGHENGDDTAYVTRVNLDVADPHHRITLLTPLGADGKTHLNRIDGSTWNPHTQTLLFTQENGNQGGVFELGLEPGATVHTLYGSLGQGGYEGIHADDLGNVYIAEDVGGTSVNAVPGDPTSPRVARVPNSYIYRFVPSDPSDLSQGRLEALQVTINGHAVTYVAVDATHPTGDAFSEVQRQLHTPGAAWPVRWVTVHSTAHDGSAPFDANALARTAGATPFKRPENLQFVPGSGFRSLVFDATGDTNMSAGIQQALAERGAWGALFRVDLAADRATGTISCIFVGDSDHAAFDNLAFASADILLVGEDRGDTLHKQLNRFDSLWAVDIAHPGAAPVRVVALGRDNLSTIDAHLLEGATPGFQNDGDNEVTGVHVADGDPSLAGLQGAHEPDGTWRWFFTQQHGRNEIFEIVGDRSLE